jgi:hypothetical protein
MDLNLKWYCMGNAIINCSLNIKFAIHCILLYLSVIRELLTSLGPAEKNPVHLENMKVNQIKDKLDVSF